MLVATSVATDNRVLREASALVDDGHDVHIVGKSVPSDFSPPRGVTVSSALSTSVLRPGGSPAERRALSLPLRFLRWLALPTHRQSTFRRWRREARRLAHEQEFDVVHAHDFSALAAGVSVSRSRSVPLIYDAHELWSGMHREYRPTPLLRVIERYQERRWGAEARAVVTVGEGLAQTLQRHYGWGDVTVVRNSFPLPTKQLPVASPPRAALYVGRLAPFRELETIAQASSRVSLPIRLVGPSDETWLRSFDPVQATVADAVSVEEASTQICEAGLSLVTLTDRWENHRLALPNKLFHAVSLGVPVVATDVGELAATVRRYGLGTLYTPGSVPSLCSAIERARTDHQNLVRNVLAAQAEMNWEVDKARLLEVYRTARL